MFNDLLCMSAVVEEGPSTSNTTSDDASLTLYFAEPTELDKYAYFVFSSDFLELTRYPIFLNENCVKSSFFSFFR